MSLDQLSASLQEVKAARFELEILSREYDGEENAFMLKTSALKAKQVAAKQRVSEAEDRAKGQALDLFKETKDKKPIKGVEIKIFTETNIEFDPSEALAWAVETGLCLKLDHEKFAKVSPILGLDFVKVTETSTPKAQLSRTL
jgi:hypothetical protein